MALRKLAVFHTSAARNRWMLAVGGLVSVYCVLYGEPATAEPRYALPAAVSPRALTAQRLRDASGNESLPMSVTLPLRQHDALDALIAAQQDPQSPDYHRWLTTAEFAARFAPAPDEYAALVGWLEDSGFAVQPSPDRVRIDFRGTVRDVERTFGVRLRHYRHRGRDRIAHEDAPLLPARFAGVVAHLRLHTFPLAEPLVRIFGSSGRVDTMAPRDIHTAYNVLPLLDRQIDGTGQTIAVVARSDFNVSDVIRFQQQFGVSVHNPTKIFPAGNPGVGAPDGVCNGIPDRRQQLACIQGEEGEVLLDAEWAGALAPGATVLVDIADTDIDASLLDIVNHHPEAKIVSISFGSCERVAAEEVAIFRPLFAQAAAQGQTVLVASGDDGADDCGDGGEAGVNALATDINVTAVGGTALNPGFDASGNATGYVNESVWNDAAGSTGGGASVLVPKPSYQDAPGVPDDGARDIPDVSLLASPETPGYVVVFRNAIAVVGGTSVSAPSWAGIIAIINHATQATGSGGFNQTLYALGRRQYGAQGIAVFHDVTDGSNQFDGVTGFAAGTGYDLATGLGTPDVDRLVQALLARPCAGDCRHDGIVTVDEVLTGVQIALGAVPLSACDALDLNGDRRVTIDEVLEGVHRALVGCAAAASAR